MARGNTAREGRTAQSELSERLRRKAKDLLSQNEDERKEAERNETEYDRAMKSAIMRAQEEVDEEFKGKRLGVDEGEQAKREAEAKKAEEDAKAEEEREARENAQKEATEEVIKNDLGSSSHPYSDYGYIDSNWAKAGGETEDKDAINPDVNIPIEQRNFIKQDYIDNAVKKAPKWMREELEAALSAFSLRDVSNIPSQGTPKDFVPYETFGNTFDDIYLRGAFGKDASKAKITIRGWEVTTPSGGTPTREQHAKGMEAIKKYDLYIAKVLSGARKGGHTERHPQYDPNE